MTLPGRSITLRLSQPIASSRLDMAALRRLCELLRERVSAAGDLEVQAFQKGNQTDEQYEANKETLRDACDLWITAKGHDGKELYGTVEEVFDSPNFPDDLALLYVNSSTTLRAVHNWVPRNQIELLLDFSRPDPFDFNEFPSRATPNDSNLKVEGIDAAWVNGLFNELLSFFHARRAPLAWIHRSSVWDVLLWGLGLPFCFWVAYRLSPFVEDTFSKYSEFVEAALYLYIFLISANVLRALFHYARWVWPPLDYVNPDHRAVAHRITLGALALGVLGSFVYDMIKFMFLNP